MKYFTICEKGSYMIAHNILHRPRLVRELKEKKTIYINRKVKGEYNTFHYLAYPYKNIKR